MCLCAGRNFVYLMPNFKIVMKPIFTLIFVSLTTLLLAQSVTFEPAHSIMNENSIASADEHFAYYGAEEMTVEVSNEFNLTFTPNPVFGDITISYDLRANSKVRLEVEKSGASAVALVEGLQESGNQRVLWDENIGAGNYTVRLYVNNKVESRTLNLTR